MKSELRLVDHKVLPGERVIEVWYGGEFVATVTGADGPGVNVISKYPITAIDVPTRIGPRAVTVKIAPRT